MDFSAIRLLHCGHLAVGSLARSFGLDAVAGFDVLSFVLRWLDVAGVRSFRFFFVISVFCVFDWY